METTKLYENNTYLRTCEAVVTEVEKEHPSGKNELPVYRVTFDQTVFFPEGGGQSSDIGRASKNGPGEHVFDVTKVTNEHGSVWHYLTGDSPSPVAGEKMILEIDWDHRFDNMQRHLGEHIFSGAFYRLFGAVNKGFHMGDSYMTVDLAIPGDKEITKEMIREAEAEANRVVWLDAPVKRMVLGTKEEAEKLPLRKDLTLSHYDEVSVIMVGDLPEPYDIVACCGTHPSTSGQVGIIKVLRSEQNKGMTRIYLEAGKRAFDILAREHDDLTAIGRSLSAGPDEALEKFRINEEKSSELRDLLYRMKQRVLTSEASDLLLDGNDDPQQGKVVVRKYDDFSASDILDLVKAVDRKRPSGMTFILVSLPEKTVILKSDVIDSGKAVKENALSLGGKGGGKPELARVRFDDEKKIDEFISKVTCQ